MNYRIVYKRKICNSCKAFLINAHLDIRSLYRKSLRQIKVSILVHKLQILELPILKTRSSIKAYKGLSIACSVYVLMIRGIPPRSFCIINSHYNRFSLSLTHYILFIFVEHLCCFCVLLPVASQVIVFPPIVLVIIVLETV